MPASLSRAPHSRGSRRFPPVLLVLLAPLLFPGAPMGADALQGQDPGYLPPPGAWEVVDPAQAGMSAEALAQAVRFIQEAESTTPTDLALAHQRSFAREPFGEAVGPFRERGPSAGVIVRGGRIVAEWGDPHRADLTFSVAKSFVSATVGLAWDQGILPDIHEPVGARMAPIQPRNPECVAPREPEGAFPQVPGPYFPFAGEHAQGITWDHLLRQTSDWEGMLWCKPDWADRPAQQKAKGRSPAALG